MTSIAVVHMDLMAKGGGEAVTMNVLEVLEDEYDVTLVTLTDPDFEVLNEYYNTQVDSVTVRRAGRTLALVHGLVGMKYYVLQNALLGRYAKRHADDYDLLISTINELGLPSGSIEYVHFPFDWLVTLANRDEIFHPSIPKDGFYERLCRRVASVDPESVAANYVLANSEWTGEVFEEAYGASPTVLYPPVDTSGFIDVPWEAREPGFVTIARIERSKRIRELIRIIDTVHQRGFETHLHIVGPPIDPDYCEEIEAMARSRPYVYLEGELPRSELVDLVCSHRYSIQGKEYEHFGIAVAELAAGGTIPFVPGTGGQSVIVEDRDPLTFTSPSDAVEKIVRVLSAPSLQRELRIGRASIERRFGRRRFRRQFGAVVRAALAGEGIETVPIRIRNPPSPSS